MFLDASFREAQSWEDPTAAERKLVTIRMLKKKNLFILLLSIRRRLSVYQKSHFSKAAQKCPDARRSKS
jgi:hypothetical protein